MAEFILDQLFGDGANVNLNLRVLEPDGIESINLRDNRGFPVEVLNPFEQGSCPTAFEFILGNIPRFKLPLEAIVISCSAQTHESPPLGETGTPAGDDPFSLPCNPLFVNPPSTLCRRNQSDLRTLRARFRSLCAQREFEMDMLRVATGGIVAALLSIAVGFAIAAGGGSIPFIGFIFIALGLAMIAFGVWQLMVWDGRRGQAAARLSLIEIDIRALREPFDSLADEVRTNCCPGAITVDLSPPC